MTVEILVCTNILAGYCNSKNKYFEKGVIKFHTVLLITYSYVYIKCPISTGWQRHLSNCYIIKLQKFCQTGY